MWKDKKDQDDEGLWKERVNDVTGESSIKILSPKTIWKSCKTGEHFFEWLDVPKRIIQCKKCKLQKRIIIGMQKLIDGKIINLR